MLKSKMVSLLLLSLVGSACGAELAFDRHELSTGPRGRQTIVSGYFLGGDMADLAVLSADSTGTARLTIFSFAGGTWTPSAQTILPPDLFFVDVLEGNFNDRLLLIASDHLSWFDPEASTIRPLLAVSTDFKPKRSIPRVDLTRDLNHDGLDDLVLPTSDGFWISTQQRSGAFPPPEKFGPPEPLLSEVAIDDTRSYAEVGQDAMTIPWYLTRVHEMDYNADGRGDLVFWNQDHFDVHLQTEDGSFDPEPRSFTTDASFDTDGLYSLAFGYADENQLKLVLGFRKRAKRTVLRSIQDMNGDGIADLMTYSIEGRSILKQQSSFDLYPGHLTPDGVRFAKEAVTAAAPRGKTTVGYSMHWLEDLDGNGQIDILHTRIGTGLWGMIRVGLFQSIKADGQSYFMEDGIYPDRPQARLAISADFDAAMGGDGTFFPSVLVGDISGDGRPDLLLGKARDDLRLFTDLRNPDQQLRVTARVPGNENHVWLADLNADGGQDIIMFHPSDDGPHQLTLLIGRRSD